MTTWVDSHCHLHMSEREPEDLLERARLVGVGWVVCPGTDVAGSEASARLAAAHPGVVLSTAGLHPHDAAMWPEQRERIESMAVDASAIGECGLAPLTHLFPSPDVLAEADVSSIGMPRARAETIRRLASDVASGNLTLDGVGRTEAVTQALQEIPGIGDWTVQYIAMRALGEPDAFPASDLGLRSALAGARLSTRALARRSERWRPWRAYAAMWLWSSLAATPTPERRTR